MPGILDRFTAQNYSHVNPQTVEEFFGLQLARKLGDLAAARHYVELAREHPEEKLLVSFRKAIAASGAYLASLPKNFHTTLSRSSGSNQMSSSGRSRLLAIKVERRTVSAVILQGRHLEDVETRHLSSFRAKAEESTVAFIRWLVANFEVESAAMEVVATDLGSQRSVLDRIITDVLTDQFLPIQRLPKMDFISTFRHPDPKSRNAAREVVQMIWPILEDDPGILDAVALGLYVQTERLFANFS
jgi:hypothetical protein